MSKTVRILVLGATGVGKSTLINYLLDTTEREVGVGKPVTEKGWFLVEKKIGDTNFQLYDTWGIEGKKTNEWENYLSEQLRENAYASGPKKWIHSTVYCINASDDRVEQYDKDNLRRLKKHQVHPIVAFTKSGAVKNDSRKQLEKELKDEEDLKDIPIVFVNSKNMNTKKGTHPQFGRKKLLLTMKKQMKRGLKEKSLQYAELELNKIRNRSLNRFDKKLQKKLRRYILVAALMFNHERTKELHSIEIAEEELEILKKEIPKFLEKLNVEIQQLAGSLELLETPNFSNETSTRLKEREYKLSEEFYKILVDPLGIISTFKALFNRDELSEVEKEFYSLSQNMVEESLAEFKAFMEKTL